MLRDLYRKGKYPFLTKQEHYDAYLLTRLPATQAAITAVLGQIREYRVRSLLDLGAGPGAGWLAAKQVFPHLETGTFIEADPKFIEIGKKMVEGGVWEKRDLRQPGTFLPHDLALMSYSLGEMESWNEVVLEAWKACQIVAVIEPGTPEGFRRILSVRDLLIQQGASVLAPCPHAKACPSNWCHFSVRLERSGEHRRAKGGLLGYEDEKFSYIVVGKEPRQLKSRIVRHPQKRKGHTVFELCTLNGLEKKVVTRSDASYKTLRKLDWGDTVDL
jgi:ribosomal protein RSM22 (predicted rRNA methylase)